MWIKNTILVILSLFVGLVISEIGMRIVVGNPYEASGAARRVLLYQTPENFLNVGEIFTYTPNQKIRSEVYYGKVGEGVDSYKKEYGYDLVVNNLGLVQRENIPFAEKVHLFLGDSYTEGQGATPWFYELEKYNKSPTIVNGGLLGTGVAQWELLAEHLQGRYKLEFIKLTIILIGDDIRRPVWNFSDSGLSCLKSTQCDAGQEDFYGFDFINKTDEEIKNESFELFKSKSTVQVEDGFIGNLKKIIKRSSLFVNSYLWLKNNGIINDDFKKDQESRYLDIKQKNLAVLSRFHNINNIRTNFILVNTKWEADNSTWDSSSMIIKERAKQEGWNLSECSLNFSDFHLNDTHPNKEGYDKLKKCVLDTSF